MKDEKNHTGEGQIREGEGGEEQQEVDIENIEDQGELLTEEEQAPELTPAEDQEWEELEDSLAESRSKAQEYLEGWQRSRAEFANYKKRIMREKKDIHKYARGEVIKHYLEIADDLSRALQDRPEEGEGAAWAEGIELIYKKLLNKLESEGVERMDAQGEYFDPNIHEAVFKQEHEDYESGQIIEVIQDGYFLGERVLRPAIVRVAA